MNNITIRQLDVEDWEELRAIRLYGLKSDPESFGSYYEKEVNFKPEQWQAWLSRPYQAIYGLYSDEDIIGLTGIVPLDDTDACDTALLVMSFIKNEYRGHGYSRILFETRINWAQEHANKFKTLRVTHAEGNEASKRAILAFGFKKVEQKTVTWHDRDSKTLHIYERPL